MLTKSKKKYNINDFSLLSVFAYGNYAKVALVRKKDDMKVYAMKVIKKQGKAKGIKKSHAYIQKQILLKCTHPFIIKMHTTFQDQNRLFFILDYCPGGQIFGLLRRMRRLSQQNCRFYAAQILLALEYLHSQKIIYRDLKPQNILLDKEGYIRLIDFGLSIFERSSSEITDKDLAGTVYYLAPQTINKGGAVGKQSDWWSFGTLIFQLIMGFPPFYCHKENILKLIQRIKKDEPPLEYINSDILRDFLKQLLEKNPQKRLGYNNIKQIKQHPWLVGINWERIKRKTLAAPFVPKLNGDDDIIWFEEQTQNCSLSPPQIGDMGTQKNVQYKSFSLSWQSSGQRSPKQLSPTEITLQGCKIDHQKQQFYDQNDEIKMIQYENNNTFEMPIQIEKEKKQRKWFKEIQQI